MSKRNPKEAVGYCSPPKDSRFQKGVSGNPRGRPKGSLNVASTFMKALRERVVIIEHERRKTVTKLEAALKQLVNKAATGDLRAMSQLVDLAREAEAKQSSPQAEATTFSEIDQEVMQGILDRFNGSEERQIDTSEAPDDDSQSG